MKPAPLPRRLVCDTRSGQRYVVVGPRSLKPHEAELGEAPIPDVHDTWRDPKGQLARHHVGMRKVLAAKGWTLIESPEMPVAVIGVDAPPVDPPRDDPEPAAEPVGMFDDLEEL